jgi:integrase
MKVKLTRARLAEAQAALKASGDRQHVLFDSELAGFGVRISRGTMAAFIDYTDRGGSKRRAMIGRVPAEISIEQARKRAAALKVDVRAGADPLAEKRAAAATARQAKAGLTVAEAIEQWLADGAGEWSSITLSSYRRLISRDITPAIGELLVTELNRSVIMAQIGRVKARSGTTASLLFKVVKAWVAYLDGQGLIEGVTLPKARQVMLSAPDPRDRVPSDELLVKIWQASAQLMPRSRALIRMILLTGQRRRSVELMRWADLDSDRGRWSIPASSMKSRKPHVAALGQLALAQLADLRRTGPHAFSEGAKPPQRITDIIQALRAETGDGWSPHDFRRCIMTWAVSRGFPRDHAKAALGHVIVTGIDRSYDRHDYEPEAARVLLAWQAHIAELIGAPPTAQVISMQRVAG